MFLISNCPTGYSLWTIIYGEIKPLGCDSVIGLSIQMPRYHWSKKLISKLIFKFRVTGKPVERNPRKNVRRVF